MYVCVVWWGCLCVGVGGGGWERRGVNDGWGRGVMRTEDEMVVR